MPNTEKKRTRQNDVRLLLTDDEMQIINDKMAQVGIKNRSLFLRKMALDGYIINIDTSQTKELTRLVNISAMNVNQVARRANETGSVYEKDVLDLLAEFNRMKLLIVEAYKYVAWLSNQ